MIQRTECGMRVVYIPPSYNPSLREFIKSNAVSDAMINSSSSCIQHFMNKLDILKVVIHCWIDKMPTK